MNFQLIKLKCCFLSFIPSIKINKGKYPKFDFFFMQADMTTARIDQKVMFFNEIS